MMRALTIAVFLLSPLGCKNDDPPRDASVSDQRPAPDLPAGTTTTVIGTAGGTAASADGKLQLEVPAAALSKPVTITVSVAQNPPAGNLLVGYDIGPTGLVFDKGVNLLIGYDRAALGGVDESRLRLGTVVGGAWQEVSGSTVDTIKQQVGASITHLSIWGIVPRPAAPDAAVDKQRPVDLTTTDLPKPWTSAFNEVWHQGGTTCDPASMVLVPKSGAIEVQLAAIPQALVQGTCGGHTTSVTLTGTTLDVTISGDTGSTCFTECWDFTFLIEGLPPGSYTVKYKTYSDSVTVAGTSG